MINSWIYFHNNQHHFSPNKIWSCIKKGNKSSVKVNFFGSLQFYEATCSLLVHKCLFHTSMVTSSTVRINSYNHRWTLLQEIKNLIFRLWFVNHCDSPAGDQFSRHWGLCGLLWSRQPLVEVRGTATSDQISVQQPSSAYAINVAYMLLGLRVCVSHFAFALVYNCRLTLLIGWIVLDCCRRLLDSSYIGLFSLKHVGIKKLL